VLHHVGVLDHDGVACPSLTRQYVAVVKRPVSTHGIKPRRTSMAALRHEASMGMIDT
jgi:hypothetical protein